MYKKILGYTMILALLLSIVTPIALSRTVKNPDTVVIATIGMPETVDPAWSYDTASGTIIFNVYETLVFPNVDREKFAGNPQKLDDFIPVLAAELPIVENTVRGPDTKYTFKIKDGVEWHDATVSTAAQLAADVEYSIERGMVQDRAWGPQWMFYEPLLDSWGAGAWDVDDDGLEPSEAAVLGPLIDACVEDYTNATGSYVEFNLAITYPPIMQILSQAWGSIVHKDWIVSKGGFPGFDVTGYDGWLPYNDPEVSELDDPDPIMMGTGPWYFNYWTGGVLPGAEWSIKKFNNYHRGWPAQRGNEVGLGFADRIPDYVTEVIEKNIEEWATRKLMFLAGDADIVYVPRPHYPEIEGQPGILGIKDIPTLSCNGFFFTIEVAPTSNNLGPGFNPATPYATGTDRIPVNFFSDVAVRKTFAQCFNWTEFIEDVYYGEAEQPPTPHIKGLVYWEYIWEGGFLTNGTYLPPIPRYSIDIAAATTLMQGTTYWADGFRFTLTYNAGNVIRQTAAEMLAYNVQSINPGLFTVDVLSVPWATFLDDLYGSKATMFIVGWLADYPDPHNFMHPFGHSAGAFAGLQGYSNPDLDALIDAGIRSSPGDARADTYHKASALYREEAPSIVMVQALGRHWEQDWYQGWYYNSLYPGGYFYHIYKAQLCDLNADGSINVGDASLISSHWFPIPPHGPGKFNLLADMNRDGSVDIIEAVIYVGET